SGSAFALGSTLVKCVATDASGNTNTCFFTITVNSTATNQPPVALCRNVTNAADANCHAAITAAQVDNGSFDPDGTIMTRTLVPPGPYGLGLTMVTLTVTDNQGATNSCAATVVVLDNTPPSITCPQNKVAVALPGQTNAVVNFVTPTASDNCSAA